MRRISDFFYSCGLGYFWPLVMLEEFIYRISNRQAKLYDIVDKCQCVLGFLTICGFCYGFCFFNPVITLIVLLVYVALSLGSFFLISY